MKQLQIILHPYLVSCAFYTIPILTILILKNFSNVLDSCLQKHSYESQTW